MIEPKKLEYFFEKIVISKISCAKAKLAGMI